MPDTTTSSNKPRKQGRPPRPLCKRGHKSGRYANGTCKECQRAASKEQYNKNPEKFRAYTREYFKKNPKQYLLNAARLRAKEGGFACTITAADIFVPEFCPLLGIKLARNPGSKGALANSPSLDKIIPALGYVPGNVWVISHRANQIKFNASLDELQVLVKNLAVAVHKFPWDKT